MRALHLTHAKLLQGVSLGAGGKGTSLSVAYIPFIEEKYRSSVIMIVLALGLSTIAPIKRMRKVTESLGRGPNQSL